jgi:DNA-binding transcriptional ArsR family regulator
LKVLTEAGLIEGDKRGRWVWYRLAPDQLSGLLDAVTSATSATTATSATSATSPTAGAHRAAV